MTRSRRGILRCWLAASLCGCATPNETPVRSNSTGSLDPPPQSLYVTLVNGHSTIASGFPLDARTIMTCAHAFWPHGTIAAADGWPVVVNVHWPPNDVPLERDWAFLKSTKDRFTSNVIDPSVELTRGDTVLIGGFRGSHAPDDLMALAACSPEIVRGTVLDPPLDVEFPAGVVAVRVPDGEYHGFSGGPAAVVDAGGVIRVWGVVVRWTGRRGPWRPWRREQELWIVRISPESLAQSAAATTQIASSP